MDSLVAIHVVVSGKVQGVWYRASTQQKATELGVKGWVRNLSNGQVELVAEGTKIQLEALVYWCHEGPPYATVTEVNTETISPTGYQKFEIRQ